jgi:phosphate transport system protein
MASIHTHRTYESELAQLRERLLLMGAKAEEVVARGIAALADRDPAAARRAIALDAEIDRLELGIDELALGILARRQPVASDLRFIAAALKMVTDLERVGDLGVNICERTIELAPEPQLPLADEVRALAVDVTAMLHDALDAFTRQDVELARVVAARDAVVDAQFARVFGGLLDCMRRGPEHVDRAARMQSLARYLERIADHATNLADMVVFIVAGKDVRHGQP